MSSIATFYLLDDDHRRAVTSALETPEKGGSVLALVGSIAHEARDLPYSGYVLGDLELLAPGTLSSEDDLGNRLTEVTRTSCISFRSDDARSVCQILSSADTSKQTIQQFLAEEGREDDYPDFVQPIQNAVIWLKECLEAIPDRHTGILVIG